MMDLRESKFVVRLFTSNCLRLGIFVSLSSALGVLVCEEVKPSEGDSVFKRSDVPFLRWHKPRKSVSSDKN